jgi:hypothetical protein
MIRFSVRVLIIVVVVTLLFTNGRNPLLCVSHRIEDGKYPIKSIDAQR